MIRRISDGLAIGALFALLANFPAQGESPWVMHVIDNTSAGADGTKLADLDGDGDEDIVAGWEQGNIARLYFDPGNTNERWPFLSLPAPDVEDALPIDLDGDGYHDIVTCSEGDYQRVTFHWAPSSRSKYKDVAYWKTRDVPATVGKTRWMFAEPMDIDGRHGIDLVVGSKDPKGTLGWLQAPENPRDMDGWQYHEISKTAWIMSIEIRDMDHDGLADVLVSDQHGDRGVRWLKNPGRDSKKLYQRWKNNDIGMQGRKVLFLGVADTDDNGLPEIYAPSLDGPYFMRFIQLDKTGLNWSRERFQNPPRGGPHCKSMAIADINEDGEPDLVTTYGGARGKLCVMWSEWDSVKKDWIHHDVSGLAGIKTDFAIVRDMDRDGDLDILTCEEANNAQEGSGLGIIWYENPLK
jgi:hypothetical protein